MRRTWIVLAVASGFASSAVPALAQSPDTRIYEMTPVAASSPSAADSPGESTDPPPAATEAANGAPAPASQAQLATTQPTSQPADSDDARAGEERALAPASAPSALGSATQRPLDFDDLTFDLGFDARVQRRQSSTRVGGRYPYDFRQTSELRELNETAGLRGSGTLFGERVADFRFDVRGGLEQTRYWESWPGRDRRSRDDDGLLYYDADMRLLPAGKVSANVFALQRDDRIARPFLPSLDRRQERYGAELTFNDPKLPMRLSYVDSYEELTSPDRDRYDEERRGNRTLNYEATAQFSDQHSLRLSYEYDDQRERYSGGASEFDTVRSRFDLDHTLQFGPQSRSRLETLARFQDEDGDLGQDIYQVAPRLRLQHTFSFATTYALQYLEQTLDENEIKEFRGDIGASYQFRDWLSSSINLYGLSQELERGSDLTEAGALGTIGIDRENDWGRFSTSLSYEYAVARADSAARSGVAVNESHTFRDPLPVTLARTDVNPFTIVVTDANRARVYVPLRDYVILPVGRYVFLERIPTGRITDGETVLVSYSYRTSQGYELNRDRVNFRIQQAFKAGWTPYYTMSFQDEDLDRTRFLGYRAREVNRHRVGLRYRQKRWSAGAEYEYNDDSIDPYQALHLDADATILQQAAHTLSGRGSYSHYEFDGARGLSGHDASLLDLGLAYEFHIDPALAATAAAAYRYEDDSLAGITNGVDLSAALNWRLGRFTAVFELAYDMLDLDRSYDGTFTAWIKLRREIPLLGQRN